MFLRVLLYLLVSSLLFTYFSVKERELNSLANTSSYDVRRSRHISTDKAVKNIFQKNAKAAEETFSDSSLTLKNSLKQEAKEFASNNAGMIKLAEKAVKKVAAYTKKSALESWKLFKSIQEYA